MADSLVTPVSHLYHRRETHGDFQDGSSQYSPSPKIPNAAQRLVHRRQYGVQLQRPLYFQTVNGAPFRIAEAYGEQDLRGRLLHHDRLVLANAGTKYTILIHIEGQEKFTRQKYAHLRNGPRSLGGVAKQIAEVIEEYINTMQHNVSSENDTWRIGPGYIEFDDLYLFQLRQVAKASYQVILGCDSRAVMGN